jgi:hypothetical protein
MHKIHKYIYMSLIYIYFSYFIHRYISYRYKFLLTQSLARSEIGSCLNSILTKKSNSKVLET